MSEIRPIYSGLISLIFTTLKLFVGLAFTVIITRLLLPEELGSWRLVLGLIGNVVIIHQVISYWATRESAREIYSGTTALIFSGILSIGGILIYYILALFTSSNTDVNLDVLLAGSIIVPILIVNRVAMAINYGWRPHLLSYGQIIYSVSMLPVLYILIQYFHFGIFGIIFSSAISYLVALFILIFFIRHRLQKKFKIEYIKIWIKRSWLSMYQYSHSLIISLDVLIFSLITQSVIGLAYFTSAWSIGIISGMASSVAAASYPKLLSEGKTDFLSQNINKLFYFIIPFTFLTIVFAKAGLFLLNPIYVAVFPAVIIISIRTFFYTFSNTFSNYLLGLENIDVNFESTLKEQLKSKLVHIPTIRIIRNSIYLISLLTLLLIVNDSNEILIIYWSIISLLSEIPFTVYFYMLVKKATRFSVDLKPLIKFFTIGIIVFYLIHLLSENYLEYEEGFFEFFLQLLPFIILSLVSYFGLTYLIDKNTRKFVKSILNELKNK
jgi:O-antigen/teichoic acid export membrane protein